MSAGGQAVDATRWSILTYGTTKVLTVLTAIALARLLDPDDFGLVALAALVMGFLFTDLGVTGSLVIARDFGRRVQGTMFTLIAGAGVAAAALVAALAPLLAGLFDEPRLEGILLVSALAALFSGTSLFYDALFQRELEFRRRFLVQLVQTAAYSGVALGLAVAGAGVWSMVVAQVVSAAVHALAALALAPRRVRPCFDRPLAREALVRGRGFWGQNVLVFAEDNADYFAVGKLLGPVPLGLYSMASRMAQLPYQAVAEPVAKVTFPMFARLHHAGEDLSRPFTAVLAGVALVTAPIGLVLSAAAEPFTLAVFGEQWRPMAGPLGALGLMAALAPLNSTLGWLFNSVGEADRLAIFSGVRLVLLLPAMLLAASLGDITTVAWVLTAHLLASVLWLAWVAGRRLGIAPARQWAALRPVVLAFPAGWLAARLAADALASAPAGVTLAAATAAGCAVYLAAVRLLAPELLAGTVRQARAGLQRGGSR